LCKYYGPEHLPHPFNNWVEKHHIDLRHIQIGQPQNNADVERFNRTERLEWLNQQYPLDVALQQ